MWVCACLSVIRCDTMFLEINLGFVAVGLISASERGKKRVKAVNKGKFNEISKHGTTFYLWLYEYKIFLNVY